mgnify:CR=1 FL=1
MNNKQNLNISNYLVTEAVDPKTNIARSIKNPKVQRAVSALKLSNPFKGY